MNDIKNTIYEIMVYINMNLFDHITLDILSERFSYSKYHLHRKFKEVTGVTLNEYIKSRRMENSIYLLFANMDVDISEIASYCGFSSATYSREFKKIFYISPKEFRNLYREVICDKKNSNIRKGSILNKKNSNICKKYEQFICYNNTDMPKEIEAISIVDIQQMELSTKIYFGNFYDMKIKKAWEDIINHNKEGKALIGIPLNLPIVTDPDSCIYLLGFESDFSISGLSRIVLDGGKYLKVGYRGLRNKIGQAHNWIVKYYFPSKDLKYDYRAQFQEYCADSEIYQDEIVCKFYIPINFT